MYCPICGQQQATEITRFCSRCGFLLTGISEVIANGGGLPQTALAPELKNMSPRQKGIRQGGIILLLSLFIIPLAALLIDALNLPDEIIAVIAIISFWGGILRMIYAAIFEAGTPKYNSSAVHPPQFVAQPTLQPNRAASNAALPPQSANFTPTNSVYAPPQTQRRGNWQNAETGELIMPSVTENTTKLLEKED